MKNPQIGDVIILEPLALPICKAIVQKRTESNENAGVFSSGTYAKQRDRNVSLEGVLGEWAASKHLNVAPDLSTRPRSKRSGTDWGDLVYRGCSIDAKSIIDPGHNLLVQSYVGANYCDAYSLYLKQSDLEWVYLGSMSGQDLCIPDRETQFSQWKPACYLAKQDELKNIDDVIAELRQARRRKQAEVINKCAK